MEQENQEADQPATTGGTYVAGSIGAVGQQEAAKKAAVAATITSLIIFIVGSLLFVLLADFQHGN